MNPGLYNTQTYFLEQWEANVTAFPDRLFLTDEMYPQGITRKTADEMSGRVCAWLKSQGIGREDFVMICLPRGALIPIAVMGVWKAGAALTVVEDTCAEERAAHIREDCGCKVVIDSSVWEEIMRQSPLSGYEAAEPHDAALAVYTSGTTGRPKGVLHEYGNIKLNMVFRQSIIDCFDQPEVRCAVVSPLSFIPFYKMLISAIDRGTHLFIVPDVTVKNPSLLRTYLEENRINKAFLSPSLIRAMHEKIPDCVKMVCTGSEAANGISLDRAKLLNIYSMSESLFSVSEFVIDRKYDVCPVGKPAEGVRVMLLGEGGEETVPGEIGEVCVEMPFFRGYINLPEQTERVLKNGIFHTGDMARTLPDGNMVLLGRSDDMFKINGNRIEPAEIEAVAKKVMGVSWACAKGFDTPARSYICLYYTENIELDLDLIREDMRRYLSEYMIPAAFLRIDRIPMLPNGKLDRKALPEPDIDSLRAAYATPENELESRIVRGFQQVLGLERISVLDDFFDLGGDSLRSIYAVEQIGEPLLTTMLLYQYRTARKIAAAVLREKDGSSVSAEKDDEQARKQDQPMIPLQRFLLDHLLFAPYSTVSNVPLLYRMPKEQVDTDRLISAFRKLIRNHAVLQSVFRIDPELGFLQHYDPSLMPELKVEYIDEEEMAKRRNTLIKPYEKLVDRPLYRIRVFQTERYVYAFMDFCHLLNDGMSVRILMRNLSDAYNGKALPHDYAYLFADETNRLPASAPYEEARRQMLEKYGKNDWCRRFTPDDPSYNVSCAAICRAFPAKKDELDRYLSDHHVTLNELCVTAALYTLSEYEGKSDVMVSWAYSGRDNVLYKDTVFPLAKEFPVAVSMDRIGSVRELIREVKEQIRLGITCQNYPFILDTTIAEINDTFRVRTLGSMLRFPGIEGIACETVALPRKQAAFGLVNLQILEGNDDSCELRLNYDDVKYKASSAERIMDLYCGSIKRILSA